MKGSSKRSARGSRSTQGTRRQYTPTARTGKAPRRAMSDADLQQAAGGAPVQHVTVNKAKTADKAFSAMDAYIRG